VNLGGRLGGLLAQSLHRGDATGLLGTDGLDSVRELLELVDNLRREILVLGGLELGQYRVLQLRELLVCQLLELGELLGDAVHGILLGSYRRRQNACSKKTYST
jgi:hypothetical protein